MDEILNVPDNIPQELLDKAKCVVVLPSVVKAAFIVGGSYGRGAMVVPEQGNDFSGRMGGSRYVRIRRWQLRLPDRRQKLQTSFC